MGNGTSSVLRSNAFSVDEGGNANVKNTINLGGADYAEFFESADGQAIPPGTSVAVDVETGLIHATQAGEEPIGVISRTAGNIGNVSEEWHGKYLRDEWGALLYETVEVTREVDDPERPGQKTGRVFTIQRPRLNPAYDPARPFISRAARPEWNVVGLMGQVRMRPGQPVRATWRRMKVLSPTVELWLLL